MIGSVRILSGESVQLLTSRIPVNTSINTSHRKSNPSVKLKLKFIQENILIYINGQNKIECSNSFLLLLYLKSRECLVFLPYSYVYTQLQHIDAEIYLQ